MSNAKNFFKSPRRFFLFSMFLATVCKEMERRWRRGEFFSQVILSPVAPLAARCCGCPTFTQLRKKGNRIMEEKNSLEKYLLRVIQVWCLSCLRKVYPHMLDPFSVRPLPPLTEKLWFHVLEVNFMVPQGLSPLWGMLSWCRRALGIPVVYLGSFQGNEAELGRGVEWKAGCLSCTTERLLLSALCLQPNFFVTSGIFLHRGEQWLLALKNPPTTGIQVVMNGLLFQLLTEELG